ncbi:response regulator transcription factor [Phascolarctobacterium sp.]
MLTILTICTPKMTKTFSELFIYSTFFEAKFIFVMDYADAVQKFYLLNPAALVIECPTSDAEEIKTFYTLTKTTPLLAVSARPDEDTAIAAYQNGATTFIRLPCGSREFYYRLFSILKKCYQIPFNELHATIDIGNIKIYTKSNRVLLNGTIVNLTHSEYNLLLLLAQNVNKTVATEEMYQRLWASGELKNTSRGLQMHLSKLRRKLGLNDDTKVRIITIHGKGYCLSTADYLL